MASKIETELFAKSVADVMAKESIAEFLDDMPMLFYITYGIRSRD